MGRVIIAAVAAAALTASAAGPLEAKKKPELTGLALQQLQSHDYESDKNIVFGAVMTVLQDAGYRIQAGDKDTGLITGIGQSSKKLTWMPFVGFGTSKKSPVVSAYIEQMGPNFTRVRLNFVMAKLKANQYGSNLGDEEAIVEAEPYRDAFEKIDQAVFLRQSMAAPRPSAQVTPSVAVAPTPSVVPAPPVRAPAGVTSTGGIIPPSGGSGS
jgi:hypothetical protein